MTIPAHQSTSRRGSTLVEFAISAGLLLMMIFAVIEFQRLLLVYTAVANAARAGNRYAIVHGSTRTGIGDPPSGSGNTTAVETVVKNFASAGVLDTSRLNIAVTYPSGNSPGSMVTVKVWYPYDPFVGWFTMLRVNLVSTTAGIITY